MELLGDAVFWVLLVLLAILVFGWLYRLAAALWVVCRRSRQDDLREKAQLMGFESIKQRIFGTKREQAAEDLRKWGMNALIVVFWLAVACLPLACGRCSSGPSAWDWMIYGD
jgi:hypothetical protein